jgi:hypothetical protein
MPLRTTLLALLLCASAATGAELKTLKGEVFKGDVVSVTAKEIAFEVVDGDKKEKKTFAVNEIASVDFAPNPAALPAVYHDVELVDGTLLHCTDLQFKGKNFIAKLTGGGDAPTTIPMDQVGNVLWGANDEKRRTTWATKIENKRTTDFFGIDAGDGVINPLPATINSANEEGTAIQFQKGDTKGNRPIGGNLIGLYFQRDIDAKMPPVVCKATDAGRNSLMVAAVESREDGLHVKTPSGLAVVYKPAQLVRLDYSTGNLAYLSDLTPSSVVETSTEDRIEHYRKDKNVDDRPIRLQGQVYNRGLGLHSHTELEYKIKGEYRTLQMVAGIDDQVGGHNRPVVLKIIAVNKNGQTTVLFNETFSRKDPKERVKPISLNIKDVQTLRIVVESADFLDLGLHLDLADARVIK